MENWEEMNKFCDAYALLKLTQNVINHFSRSIMSNEIEVLIL
jgi:hypothetical protein